MRHFQIGRSMVKASGFIDGITDIVGKSPQTVEGTYRVLREAHYLTTGARGINAPSMVYRDATRMLIAFLVSDRPVDAVHAVAHFGGLVDISEQFMAKRETFALGATALEPGHTLEDAITELIRLYALDENKPRWMAQSLDPAIQMREPECVISIAASQLRATIKINGRVYIYEDPKYDPAWAGSMITTKKPDKHYSARIERWFTNIQCERSVSTHIISKLADLLRDESDNADKNSMKQGLR